MSLHTDMTPNLREAEHRTLYEILAVRQPAVVLVCGSPGMGKSWLLRDLRRGATSQGWYVASDLDRGVLRIDPQTSPRQFRSAVLEALEADPSDDRSRARRATAVADPEPLSRRLEPFVEELARHAPVLVIVDDYRPGAAFARWFQNAFLRQVPSCSAPVVVVVAQPPGGGELAAVTTTLIELEELDQGEIRAALRGAEIRVDPPLSEAEIETYAREIRNPLDLDSLIRALSFMADHQERES